MSKFIEAVVGILVLSGALLMVSLHVGFKKDDATERYCRNVYDGIWPDYSGNYDKQCFKGYPRR